MKKNCKNPTVMLEKGDLVLTKNQVNTLLHNNKSLLESIQMIQAVFGLQTHDSPVFDSMDNLCDTLVDIVIYSNSILKNEEIPF